MRRITDIQEVKGLLLTPNCEGLDRIKIRTTSEYCDWITEDTDDALPEGSECQLIGLIRRYREYSLWLVEGEVDELLVGIVLTDEELMEQEVYIED